MKKLNKFLVLTLILGSSSVAFSQSGVYRWVDAQGRVHFSGQPPDALGAKTGDSAKKLNPKALGATPENISAQRSLDQSVKASASEAKTRAETEAKAQARLEKERARDRDCNAAAESVRQYSSGQRLAIVQANGERKFLEDDEIAQRLADAQKREKDACAPLPPDEPSAPQAPTSVAPKIVSPSTNGSNAK